MLFTILNIIDMSNKKKTTDKAFDKSVTFNKQKSKCVKNITVNKEWN